MGWRWTPRTSAAATTTAAEEIGRWPHVGGDAVMRAGVLVAVGDQPFPMLHHVGTVAVYLQPGQGLRQ